MNEVLTVNDAESRQSTKDSSTMRLSIRLQSKPSIIILTTLNVTHHTLVIHVTLQYLLIIHLHFTLFLLSLLNQFYHQTHTIHKSNIILLYLIVILKTYIFIIFYHPFYNCKSFICSRIYCSLSSYKSSFKINNICNAH